MVRGAFLSIDILNHQMEENIVVVVVVVVSNKFHKEIVYIFDLESDSVIQKKGDEYLEMGEKESDRQGLRKRRAAIGSERQGLQDGNGELERLEEQARGAAGEDVDILGELVEGSHQLHHHLPSRLLQRRRIGGRR